MSVNFDRLTSAQCNDLFNGKLKEMVDDMKCVVGHLTEYTLLSGGVTWLAAHQPTRNQELFDTYVCQPFEKYIVRRDEQFFLSTDYGGVNNNQMNLVQMLKSVWATLGESDKNAIWNHLNVLTVLNDQCKKKKMMMR